MSRLPALLWFRVRGAMRRRVEVRDPADGLGYRFVADSYRSYARAKSLLTKEAGTIAWLREHVRPADVFLDVGANIGTFSIFAAQRLSGEGHVYACEPHLPTAAALLANIAENDLRDRISPLSIALSDCDGFAPFHYRKWEEGSSGSGLHAGKGAGTEIKGTARVDSLVAAKIVRAPDLVKIDTDGHELRILAGMRELLVGPRRPRSILVEVQPGEIERQVELMRESGYALVRIDALGAGMSVRGANAIFEPTLPRE